MTLCRLVTRRVTLIAADKVITCQVGVFAAYVSVKSHAFVDRVPCLRKSWIADPTRLGAAQVRDSTAHHRRLVEPNENIAPAEAEQQYLPRTTSIWQRDSQHNASGQKRASHTLSKADEPRPPDHALMSVFNLQDARHHPRDGAAMI